MTAATQDIKTPKLGTEEIPPPTLLGLPVETNTQIFGGTMVASNAAGNAVPAKISTALIVWGRCERGINNLNTNTPYGAAGAQNVTVRPGAYYWASDGSVTAGMVGQPVFALDDETVTTNPAVAGATYWLPYAGTVQPPGVGEAGIFLASNTKIPVLVGEAPSLVLHGTIDIPLATLQAKTSTTAFNIGPALPANIIILASDINVVTVLAGGGTSASVAQVQNTGETAGSFLGGTAGTNVFTGAPLGPVQEPVGLNPYGRRGTQQLQMTVTNTGAAMSALTTGHLQVDIYYSILQ
jgi:hypothetical protein